MDTSNVTTTTRKCPKCETTFPLNSENFHRRKDDFVRLCKACACEHVRLWRENNLEKDRAHSRAYRKQHREEALERCRLYGEAHKDEKREYDRAYRAANQEKRKAHHHKRRAFKRGNGGTHTPNDVAIQVRMQTDKKGVLRCWWCSKSVCSEYHIDHRIPLARGGNNAPENIVISCPTCNMSRKDKLPSEWGDRLL